MRGRLVRYAVTMSLVTALEGQFDGRSLQRGERYASKDRVRLIDESDTRHPPLQRETYSRDLRAFTDALPRVDHRLTSRLKKQGRP